MKKRASLFFFPVILTCLLIGSAVFAEDFATALSSGEIKVGFRGMGGSSGDSIAMTISKTRGDNLDLMIPAGTRLETGSRSAQNMVISGIKGEMAGQGTYTPASSITVGDTPQTYVLEAYCTDFEKDNPSAGTRFSVGRVDPVLASILQRAAGLSVAAKQAAVWIYTDRATFDEVNRKFSVSRSDWAAAEAVTGSAHSGASSSSMEAGPRERSYSEDSAPETGPRERSYSEDSGTDRPPAREDAQSAPPDTFPAPSTRETDSRPESYTVVGQPDGAAASGATESTPPETSSESSTTDSSTRRQQY